MTRSYLIGSDVRDNGKVTYPDSQLTYMYPRTLYKNTCKNLLVASGYLL